MTCPGCVAAAQDATTGIYSAGCQACTARALANSPGYHASMIARRMRSDYSEALARIAGPDKAAQEALHRDVKSWAWRIADAIDQRTSQQAADVWEP